MIFLPQPLNDLQQQLANWPNLRIVSQQRGVQVIPPAELVYLSGEYNYSWLHCVDGYRLLVPYTLKRMLTRLPPSSFIRLHRSYVVNRHYVERVETHPTSNHRLYLVGGLSLPVSRRNWVRIRQQLLLDKKPAFRLLAA